MDDLRIYCDEIEVQLKEWNTKIEGLEVKARLARGDEQAELNDELHFLKLKKAAVDQKLTALKDATGDACVLIRDDLDEALKDLETSFRNAAVKFK